LSVAVNVTPKLGQTWVFWAGTKLVMVGKVVSVEMPQADPLVVEWAVTQDVKSLWVG
jgi:hypothetical protein